MKQLKWLLLTVLASGFLLTSLIHGSPSAEIASKIGSVLGQASNQIPSQPGDPTASQSNTLTTSRPSGQPGHCQAIQVDPNDPQAFVPDPNCTPGVINPDVTQNTIGSTICVKGYTGTIRPPVSYTNNLKRQQIAEYGYGDTSSIDYEEDHFISLELGGSPTDPKNLWPEPHPSINEKDKVENYLHEQVCSGQMTLVQAQQAITSNWYKVYQGLK